MSIFQDSKVSIIILTRGIGIPLINTLESIFNQTYKNIELFLVSEEFNEAGKINLYPYRDRISFVIDQKGNSRGRILNHALKLAQGKYFSILAAGDVWQPTSLAQNITFLEKNTAASAVCSDFDIFDKNGIINKSFFEERNLFQDAKTGDSFVIDKAYRQITQSRLRPISTVLMRIESFNFCGPFNEKLYGYDDFDLFLRLSRKSHVGFINKVLGSRFFDVYKVAYYINENMRNRMAYFEDLLADFDKNDKSFNDLILLHIRRDYLYWSKYLIKVKKNNEARKVIIEYMSHYNITFDMLWLLFGAIVGSDFGVREGKYSYFFRTEALKNELFNMHF